MPILDTLIADLREGVSEGQATVHSIVQSALIDHERFAADLQARSKPWFFVADDTLTMFCTDARPGSASAPHDHGLWSVIGCFAGAEESWWQREENNAEGDRKGKRLVTIGSGVLRPGECHSLARDVTHSVMNRWNVANGIVHVYAGNFLASERSIWDPVTSERHIAGLTEPLAPLHGEGGLSIPIDANVDRIGLAGTAFAAIAVDDVQQTAEWMAMMLDLTMLTNQDATCATGERFTYLIDPVSLTAIGIHGRGDVEVAESVTGSKQAGFDHLALRLSSMDQLLAWRTLLSSRGADPSAITKWDYGTFVEVVAPGNVRVRLIVLQVA